MNDGLISIERNIDDREGRGVNAQTFQCCDEFADVVVVPSTDGVNIDFTENVNESDEQIGNAQVQQENGITETLTTVIEQFRQNTKIDRHSEKKETSVDYGQPMVETLIRLTDCGFETNGRILHHHRHRKSNGSEEERKFLFVRFERKQKRDLNRQSRGEEEKEIFSLPRHS